MQTTLNWRPYHREQLPPLWRDWLGIRGSLTKALEEKGGQSCIVTVHREGYDYPLKAHWVREVTLSQQRPLVHARSVLPRALIEASPEFAQLGTTALGRLLFSHDPNIYRGVIEVAQQADGLWARRSCFQVRMHAVWVYEVFLDAVALL